MYSRYFKESANSAQKYIKELVPYVDSKTAKRLYEERIRLFEILDVCLDMSTYLLVLSLKATSAIDRHAHLHVNEDLVGYGRAAMQEMLVIRVREFFQAEKDAPNKFKFHGFHETLREVGAGDYPMPNIETNNAIARIIRRRNFYSAHHGDGKRNHTLTRNPLHALDLIITMAYIAKVEENLHKGKAFDPFERLLDDGLEADRPLVLCSVYEVFSGLEYERLDKSDVLYTLPSGVDVVSGDYEDTPEFAAYEARARKEIEKIRLKVKKIIEDC